MPCVVIVIPGFAKDEQDSLCLPPMQQFILCAQRALPDFTLLIVSLQYPFERKNYTWHNIPVFAIGGSNRPGLRRFITWIKTYRQLQKIRKQYQPQGILSLWLHETALVSKFFAARAKLPHYIWLQGQDIKKTNQYIARVQPKASELIAISEFTQETYFVNHGIRPFMVANNGVNKALFEELNTTTRDIDILGVGNLIALKNYSFFIDIVSALKSFFPNIRAMIAGEGPELHLLQQKVNTLQLNNNIQFTGALPHAETLRLMNRSKVFLHTSLFEGNSTVLIEALYSGCKTFSTVPLSQQPVENLRVLTQQKEFVKDIHEVLNQALPSVKRVMFNDMEDSAKKIFGLFAAVGQQGR
jgi:glycosyltransferase involved in cell wall biosynthesis